MIQVVLGILFALFLAIGAGSYLRGRKFFGLSLSLVSAFAIFLSVNPEVSSVAASIFGVGRGVDLIFYLFIPVSLMINIALFNKFQRQESKIESLARSIAISEFRRDSELPPE